MNATLRNLLTRFAAIAAVLCGTHAASAGRLVDRIEVMPGDTAIGDILAPKDINEISTVLPRGAVASYTVMRTAPGKLLPAVGGLLTPGFDSVGLLSVPPSTIRSVPLPVSGLYRFVMSGGGTTLGGYRVRLAVQPARGAKTTGATGDAATPLVFGAFAGASVDLAIRWKGPAPVVLTSMTGPTGEELAADGAALERPTSSTQRGFAVTATGDQTVTFAVPEGTVSWSVSVKIKTPKFHGRTVDGRADGLPGTPPFEVIDGGFPWCRLLDEVGGPNAWLLTSSGVRPNGSPLDPRRGSCGLQPFNGTFETATEYLISCTGGFTARISNVVRDGGGLVLSYDVPDMRDPDGSGSTSFEAFQYDAQQRPVSWKETRRFAANGHVHQFVVEDVTRFGGGAVQAARVTHTDPSGAVRTYTYGPYR